MSELEPESPPEPSDVPARKRPKPGERRVQILQALAAMLEQPGAERVTTAALAARLSVSEAALYRHFASKAQMFEALIDFIEASVFSLINQLQERMNLFFDKLEAQWRQPLREALAATAMPTVEAQVRAALLHAFVLGRLQRYARSGFRRAPSENLEASLTIVLAVA